MKRLDVGRAAVLMCVLLAPLACAATPADAGVTAAPSDEVVVKGARTLDELRLKMVELEDRFYSRYNELNPIRDFDVHCAQEARVGTILKRRYCRAVYESKAFEAEGRETAQFLQRIEQPSGNIAPGVPPPSPIVAGGPPAPAIMAIEARRPQFKKNMVDLTTKHPELLQLLKERAELEKRYKSAHRQVFGRKPSPKAKE